MFRYFITRIIFMIPTLIGITILTFIIINATPGGPIEQKIQAIRYGSGGEMGVSSGRSAGYIDNETLEELKKYYGFDKPVYIRYWNWLLNIVRLDFGTSTAYGEPVIDLILNSIPISLQFGITSYILIYLFSILVGVLMALKENKFIDHSIQIFLFIFYGIPPLILSMTLIVIFAGGSHLDWFPAGGLKSDNYEELDTWLKIKDRIMHLILPLSVYTLSGLTTHTMLMRNSMLETLGQDFIKTARAKGISEMVIHFRHTLRNAILPMLNGMGAFLSVFFTGSLIVETVFRINGMGYLSYKALLDRDYNLIMGIILLSSILMLLSRLITDFLYVYFDPRIDFK